MPSRAQLVEERDAKRKNLADIFARYPDMNIPETEAKSIRERNDELTVIVKSIEDIDDFERIKAGANPEEVKRQRENDSPFGEGSGSGAKTRTFGDVFKAKGYSEWAKKSDRSGYFSMSLDEAETKTLLDLSILNNPATRLPGIVNSIQDEKPGVGDLVAPGTTDNNTISYMEETTFTNNAAETAEGATKPEAALAYTERTENVRKIPVWIPVTTEFLEDISGVQSMIEGRLKLMIKQREEGQLLVGNGTAPNISGILDRAIQTQAKGADTVPDAVYKAITKVEVTGDADPDWFVTNPNDWQAVRLLTTTDGIYIWGSPAEAGPERIWGLNVRKTARITENTGLVGAFRQYAQVFRRTGIDIKIGDQHSDYFVNNKVVILAEERLAFAVYRPYAFCSVTSI